MLTFEICNNCGYEEESTRKLPDKEKRILDKNTYDFQIKNMLSQKGIELKCPVCDSDNLEGHRRLLKGALRKEFEEDSAFPEDLVLELAVLKCQKCANVLFFDSQQLGLKPLLYGEHDEF